MGQQQSLADQLGWCITTKDYLNNLNMELKSVAQQYQRSIRIILPRGLGYIGQRWMPTTFRKKPWEGNSKENLIG